MSMGPQRRTGFLTSLERNVNVILFLFSKHSISKRTHFSCLAILFDFHIHFCIMYFQQILKFFEVLFISPSSLKSMPRNSTVLKEVQQSPLDPSPIHEHDTLYTCVYQMIFKLLHFRCDILFTVHI